MQAPLPGMGMLEICPCQMHSCEVERETTIGPTKDILRKYLAWFESQLMGPQLLNLNPSTLLSKPCTPKAHRPETLSAFCKEYFKVVVDEQEGCFSGA